MVVARKSGRQRQPPAGFKYVPPDGGFGWFIVLGGSVAGAVITVPLLAFGLIFADILRDLDTDTSSASWVPSICISASMLIAPVANIVITKYSCRMATIIGGILASVGMILSYFVTNVVVLFLTFGVIYGAGFGFVVSATVLVLSDFFRTHYGLATGISFACFAAGKLIFSPIVQLMLEYMDYHGLFLVLGALSLNVCVGGALFQPSHWHRKLVPIEPSPSTSLPDQPETSDVKNANGHAELGSAANGSAIANGLSKPSIINQENGDVRNGSFSVHEKQSLTGNGNAHLHHLENGRSRTASINSRGATKDSAAVWLLRPEFAANSANKHNVNLSSSWDIFGSVHSVQLRDEPPDGDSGDAEKNEASATGGLDGKAGCYDWWKTGPMKLDVALLKEPIFHILMWGGMLASAVSVYMAVYLPSLMLENGVLPMEAAVVMSVKAGGEIAGRVATPYVQEFFKIPLFPFYLSLNFAQVVLIVLMTYMTSFGTFLTVTLLSGLVGGGYVGLIMLVYVDSVGYGRLSSIIALTKLLQGVLSLGVGPIIGLVKDMVGAFDVCFYILAGIQSLAFVVWVLQPRAKRKSFVT